MERNTMSYKARQFLMFAGPALILFCMVIIIPFVYGLYLTFTSWTVSLHPNLLWALQTMCLPLKIIISGPQSEER